MKNFKHLTKRGLSLFIALMMCMSVTSLTAFAEDEVTEPVETVEQVTEPAGETQDPVEVVEPVEDVTPVEEETPAEDPAPVEEETPAEAEKPAEVEKPAETETPAAEEEPAVEAVVANLTGVSITPAVSNTAESGNFVMMAPGTTMMQDVVVSITTDAASTFSVTENPQEGEFYVSSVTDTAVTMNFNISVTREGHTINLNESQYAMTLTSNGTNGWTGRFGVFSNMSLNDLANILADETVANIQMAAGVLNGNSAARQILVNQDTTNVMVVLCAPQVSVYPVTYVVKDGDTFTWNYASGMKVVRPALALTSNQTVAGWYLNAAYSDVLAEGAVVSGPMTIYVNTTTTSTGDVLEDLKGTGTVTIKDLPDWEVFVANSTLASEGQLVELAGDINCGGATYTTLSFDGNFNGNNHTISNAKFTPATGAYADGYTEEITCCGLFNSLRKGQKVGNLKLDNIRTSGSTLTTYSGALAGVIDGNGSARIQNVQVTNCNLSGRSAGGVVGFCRGATIEFCSSKTSTISGLANGGGIVGITSGGGGVVKNCFSTCNPTCLGFGNASKGGVVSKLVRGGAASFCWSTMDPVVGGNAGTNCLVVNSNTEPEEFEALKFDPTYWYFEKGTATDFDFDEIGYDFQQ